MIKTKKNKVNIPKTTEGKEHVKTQDFLDMCSPTAMRFFSDFYIINSTYRSVWAIREYQSSTKEQAILRHLGEKSGVNLRVYTRHVSPMEERKIISNATNKSRLKANTTSLQDNIVAESNLQDVANLVATMHQNKEPLLYSAVFIELQANNHEELKELQADTMSELTRSKISVDKLYLRQKEGFQSCQLTGSNMFRDQFERVLPASSVANLFPFSYSGKTDPKGFYLGKDKYGSNGAKRSSITI